MDSQVQATSLPGAEAASLSDEKIWAALSHASAVLVFFGPVVPLILWGTQRKKSPYVAFHALQAMLYQALFFWVWMLIIPIIIVVVMVIAIAVMVTSNPRAAEQPFAILGMQLAMFGVMFGSILLYMAVGVIGAVACLMGRDFRYPVLGSRLARHLEYQGADGPALPQDKQYHVLASVSHATVVLFLWGLITPILVWITEHERSAYVHFQALQAAIYQGIGTVAYFVVLVFYMLSSFGMMGAALALGSSSDSSAPAWFGLATIPLFCIMCGLALAGPLYHLFGFLG